ncbi:MAG: hypothetical protein ACRDOE_09320, partial [Streptosporangiaceae bacterium]
MRALVTCPGRAAGCWQSAGKLPPALEEHELGDNPDPGDPLVVQDVVELEHAADGKEQRIARVENTQRVSLVGADYQRPVPDVPLARLGGGAGDQRVSHRALQV